MVGEGKTSESTVDEGLLDLNRENLMNKTLKTYFIFLFLLTFCYALSSNLYADKYLGKYVNKHKPQDYFELEKDGKFIAREKSISITGKWERVDNEIRLYATVFGTDTVTRLEIKENELVDEDGDVWISEEEYEKLVKKTQEELARSKLEVLKQDEEIERLEAEIRKKGVALQPLEVLLPRKRETDVLLRQLQAVAVDSNLKILRFTPRGSMDKDFYSEWPIPIFLSGSLKDLESYIDSLSKYNRLLDIQEINLVKRESADSGEVLFLDFTLKIFCSNEEASPSERTSGPSSSWKQDRIQSLNLQNDILNKKIEILARLRAEQEAIPSKFQSSLSNR